MRKKRFLAGILTAAMVNASLALPGNTLQAEAASKTIKKITIAKKATIYVGTKKKLKVTKAPKAASAKITWKSSDKKIASVNSKGVVKGIKAGSVTVTASVKGKNSIKSSCKVTVKKPRLIKKLKADSAKLTLDAGSSRTIKTTITPKNASIKKLKYKSSNTSVASVSSKGRITAKKAGTATITVSATDGSKKKTTVQVTVKASAAPQVKVSKITVKKTEITLEAGAKQKLETTIAPSNATNRQLKYTLSDPYAASVSADGTITALTQGSTDITIEAADGSGAKATAHVTVVDTDKPRAIITQDGEVDDQNSMIHLLLYGNEIDIQGIIQTSSQFHWIGDENGPDEASKKPYRWPGTDWMTELADDYAAVYGNLRTHDRAYPTPNYIRSMIKIGNIAYKGDMRKETEGSKLIEAAFLDNDPRTLYVMAWGGPNTIARALKSIEEKYKNTDQWDAVRKKIIDKTVIGAYGTQDQTYDEYIGVEWPEIKFVQVSATSYGYGWSRSAGTVDSEAKRTMSGAWIRENLDYGHGPLLDKYVVWGDGTYLPGEEEGSQFGTNESLVDSTDWWGGSFIGKYQRYDFLSEGDSPSFFPLMNTGLRSLENLMAYGSYAGRYTKVTNRPNQLQNWYQTAKDYDPLQNKTVSSDWRFMADIQHQFATRADWCITPKYEDANHMPSLTIKEGLDFKAAPGQKLTFHAKTSDPDGDYVSVNWEQYFEADTYQEPEENKGIYIKGANSDTATITVPEDAKENDTLVINVRATDNGTHSLSYYQQIVITVTSASQPTSINVSGDTTVEAGKRITLAAEVLPETATVKTVTWSSSSEAIATVNEKGQVTGVSEGPVTITATSKSDKSIKGNIEITVTRTAGDPANSKPRAIITQDGEVDDQNSLIHLLLYSNEIDIQGIIQTSSKYHWIGDDNGPDEASKKPYRWPGTDWMMELADDYAAVYDNLRTHDPAYPTPDFIRSKIKLGNIAFKGDMREETEGSRLIEAAFLDNDPRTLYVMAWGGPNTIARALKSIEEKYKNTDQWDAIRKKIIDKTVIGAYGTQDQTYDEYIGVEWPEIKFVQVSATSYGYFWSNSAGNVDSEAKRTMSGAWMRENLDYGHGPLLDKYVVWGDGTYLPGEEDGSQFGSNEDLLDSTNWWGGKKYQRYDFLSEGDSPSFFPLMNTGLRSLENLMAYGSFAGRYTKVENRPNKLQNWYQTAKDYDPLQSKTVSSDWRFMADIQHQFATRADWCITPKYEDANHTPSLTIAEGLDFEAAPGQKLTFHAKTSDPDGDYVAVNWEHYFEADTYQEPEANKGIYIKGAESDTATITVPEDAKNGDTIVLNVRAADNGTHSLSYYQQIVITVAGRTELGNLSLTSGLQDDTIVYGDPKQGWGGPSYSDYAKQLILKNIDKDGNEASLAGKTFTWTSSDTNIATVSNTGTVTPAGQEGTVKITVTANDGSGKSAEITLTLTYAGTPPASETGTKEAEQKSSDSAEAAQPADSKDPGPTTAEETQNNDSTQPAEIPSQDGTNPETAGGESIS